MASAISNGQERTLQLLWGMQTVLAIDQGTTGSNASLFDANSLELICTQKVDYPQVYPHPGWVEHSPEEIWKSIVEAIRNTLELAKSKVNAFSSKSIVTIGITNQRETVVGWNKRTGEVIGNAIVWQDRRTADFCDTLKSDESIRTRILENTGLVCDPYFSGSKIKWMVENIPKAKELQKSGDLTFGTMDSYVIYKLTAGKSIVTDHTNASRTMLYNLRSGEFDQELCNIFEVKKEDLPMIASSSGHLGVISKVPGLHDGIPITGCLGDQQAALFGHGFTKKGEGKITYGTGTFLLTSTGDEPIISHDGLLTTVAYSEKNRRSFALEGSAFIAGAAVQFLRDNFQWFAKSSESDLLAVSQERDKNILFIPAFAGLGAPYWNPHAKGVLFGLTRGTSKAQVTRGVLESIALQNVLILNLMKKASKTSLNRLGVDGGAARSDLLMQFQSDVTRVSLIRPQNIEVTAKGAARAALMGLNPGASIQSKESSQQFKPVMNEKEADDIVASWTKAAEAVNRFYS